MKRNSIKLNKNRKGFTLVEVVITLAILSIVLATAFNLFGFNLTVYSKGQSLSQVQFDIRMAADYITSEIRNVSEINLLEIDYDNENIEDNEEVEDHNYINTSTLKSSHPSLDSVQFSISVENTSYLLAFVVAGSNSRGDNEYVLETEVLLNNLTNSSVPIDIWYNSLIYKK